MGFVRGLSESCEPLERSQGDSSDWRPDPRVGCSPPRQAQTDRQHGRNHHRVGGRAKIVTQNEPSATVPFKQAEATLILERNDGGSLITSDYRYVPRGGPLGRLTGPLIDRKLIADFNGMLAAIKNAALAGE